MRKNTKCHKTKIDYAPSGIKKIMTTPSNHHYIHIPTMGRPYIIKNWNELDNENYKRVQKAVEGDFDCWGNHNSRFIIHPMFVKCRVEWECLDNFMNDYFNPEIKDCKSMVYVNGNGANNGLCVNTASLILGTAHGNCPHVFGSILIKTTKKKVFDKYFKDQLKERNLFEDCESESDESEE